MTSGTTPQSSYLFLLFPPNVITDHDLNLEVFDYGIIPFHCKAGLEPISDRVPRPMRTRTEWEVKKNADLLLMAA
jgi:hypothetical protein